MLRFSLFLILFIYPAFISIGYAQGCEKECAVAGCSQQASVGNTVNTELFGSVFFGVIAILLAFYLYRKFKSKYYLVGGAIVVGILAAVSVFQPFQPDHKPESCSVVADTVYAVLTDTAASIDFLPADDDFIPLSTMKGGDAGFAESQPNDTATRQDSTTSNTDDEFVSATDEFSSGEFQAADEFALTANETEHGLSKADKRFLIELGILFLLVAILGFLVRYEQVRRFRGLFLLATVVYFGFIKGACPCMILSLHNTILAAIGQPVAWITLIWFIGLLPLTYFFGKTWCGWLCHLGGLQEFLYQAFKLDIMKSLKAQNIMRGVRIAVLIILIIQLSITKTNIFIHYDPFKVAYNLFSANTTGYILLVLLLLSSVLIYRPFCRSVCPVGLIMGWISLLPGARVLSKNETCIDCKLCSNACKTKAIVHENGKSTLCVQDCIMCGECMGSCRKNSLTLC